MRIGLLILLSVSVSMGCGAAELPPVNVRPPQIVRFDRVELSDDSLAVRVDFIGARAFDPDDSCTHDYGMETAMIDDVLEITLTQLPHPLEGAAPEGVLCTAEGHPRQAVATLEEPFLGTTVRDRAGYVHFVRRPAGLVELEAIPAGWTLRRERSVEESPTGRWHRTWDRGAVVQEGFPGSLGLYQSFGSPAGVSGGEEIRVVEVRGEPATLYRAPHGELILVWEFEGDGLALDANEADFTVEALIELATSTVGGG